MTDNTHVDDDEGGLDLGRLLGAVRRKLLLISGVTIVVAGAAVYKAITDTPIYQAELEILTQPVAISTQVISSANPQTLSHREEIVAVTLDAVQLKLLTSPRVIVPIVEELQSQYPGITYKFIASNLRIRPTPENILIVGYQHPNKDLVKSVLDLVSQAFLNFSLETRQQDILKGIEFVGEQIPQLQQRVDNQQERLQTLRQTNNLLNPETEGSKLSTQVTAIEQQLLENQLQLGQAKALYANLQRELANQSPEYAIASVLMESPRYQEIMNQLRAIDNQIAKESVLYLEESPEISILQEQRESLLPLLQRETNRVSQEWASKIQDLEERNLILQDTIDRINAEVKQLSVVSREYTDIQRELLIATDNLNQFLAKREAFKIDMAQRDAPWELLTPPGEPKPSSASLKKNLVLGTALGLLLGLGLALLVDQLSNMIYTVKEVKEATRLPILGVIPFDRHLKSTVSQNINPDGYALENSEDLDLGVGSSNQSQGNVMSAFYESFRSLYTSIRLLSPDQQIRSMVISSSVPGEGKSTTAIYLALAAAEQGRKVLLVDSDLRCPSLHQQLGLINMQGLTDLISSDALDIDIERVIQPYFLESNLFVLTSGSTPPDPIRILSSHRMINLIRKLEQDFDLVIYDAPPMLGLADANLLASETSGMVLVASLGRINRSVLENAIAQLKEHPNMSAPILGVVANRSPEVPLSSYSYSFSNPQFRQNPRNWTPQKVNSSSSIVGTVPRTNARKS
ncbi:MULTISPECIES: GumC family protein [Limnospira]|uniref:non-specific protein-tyrosine kinase n=1 Tax=Limnospira indica PCC 8005 TaxID=376219 RepID=A0A9P1KJ59_9CYAN|nr:polysaccharide biosynthesis tyrosine autokinase [Limnospira indica]CDM98141.1 putative Non-specific protein-tyrosine kinase [Limnospira indica PCC 8005]